MKDLENQKVPISRFRNKIYSKYENALIYKFNDNDLSEIMRGERNFKTIDWYPEYSGNRKYKSKEYQALIVDKEDNFKMFVEFTYEEVKLYKDIKKKIEKNAEKLKQENKKSFELKTSSKDIKDKINKLKVSKLKKDNYILSKKDKDSFISFIKQVDNTNQEYDKIQTLSSILINANEELENKDKKISTLTENNKVLYLRVDSLSKTIKEKANEISYLKSKLNDLKGTLEYFKDKFSILISFLHKKLHSWYDKDDKYIDVVNEMYDDNVLDNDDIEELDLSKEKDDFEK